MREKIYNYELQFFFLCGLLCFVSSVFVMKYDSHVCDFNRCVHRRRKQFLSVAIHFVLGRVSSVNETFTH